MGKCFFIRTNSPPMQVFNHSDGWLSPTESNHKHFSKLSLSDSCVIFMVILFVIFTYIYVYFDLFVQHSILHHWILGIIFLPFYYQ